MNSNREIISLELVDQVKSINSKGFESFRIDAGITDEEYYVIIRFVEGTDADVFLTFSQGNDFGFSSGSVSTDDVGKDLYYGPISKTGNNFSFR